MDRQSKIAFVEEYGDRIRNAKLVVVANYKGTTVEEIDRLRTAVRKLPGAEYRVVKNSLVKRIVAESDMSGLTDHLSGCNGLLIASEDPVEPAKALIEFAKEAESFEVKAGALDGSVIDAAGVEQLSKLPGKPELQAKLLGVLAAPARNFVSLLAAVPRGLLNVLSAYKDKMDGGEEG